MLLVYCNRLVTMLVTDVTDVRYTFCVCNYYTNASIFLLCCSQTLVNAWRTPAGTINEHLWDWLKRRSYTLLGRKLTFVPFLVCQEQERDRVDLHARPGARRFWTIRPR